MAIANLKLTISVPTPARAVFYGALGFNWAFGGGRITELTATIDLAKDDASALTVGPLKWEPRKRFRGQDAHTVPDQPAWSRDPGGAQPVTAQLTRTPQNLDVVWRAPDDARHGVLFHVDGSEPQLPAAPAVTAEIWLGLREQDGAIEYRFVVPSRHDGFPDYDLQVNAKPVYHWSCVDQATSPLALAWPMERVAAPTVWTRL